MSELVVPDGITPLSGWRAWIVDTDGVLRSRTNSMRWLPGKALHARCSHLGDLGSQVIPLSKLWEAGAVLAGRAVSTVMSVEPRLVEVYAVYQSAQAHRRGFHTHGIESLPDPVIYDEASGEHFIPLPGDRRLVVPPPAPAAAPEPEVPSATCSCGIYCADDRSAAEHYMSESGDSVLGRVALWGRVVRHDTGMRGEYAYPQVFYTDDPGLKQKLAAYGVPILSRKELPPQAGFSHSVLVPTAAQRMAAPMNYAVASIMVGVLLYLSLRLLLAALGWLPPLPELPILK